MLSCCRPDVHHSLQAHPQLPVCHALLQNQDLPGGDLPGGQARRAVPGAQTAARGWCRAWRAPCVSSGHLCTFLGQLLAHISSCSVQPPGSQLLQTRQLGGSPGALLCQTQPPADRVAWWQVRLQHLGVKVTHTEDEEYCLIPMGGVLPRLPQRVLGIGGTGGMVHPSTGELQMREAGGGRPVADGRSCWHGTWVGHGQGPAGWWRRGLSQLQQEAAPSSCRRFHAGRKPCASICTRPAAEPATSHRGNACSGPGMQPRHAPATSSACPMRRCRAPLQGLTQAVCRLHGGPHAGSCASAG